jgi:hypothetical protein
MLGVCATMIFEASSAKPTLGGVLLSPGAIQLPGRARIGSFAPARATTSGTERKSSKTSAVGQSEMGYTSCEDRDESASLSSSRTSWFSSANETTSMRDE